MITLGRKISFPLLLPIVALPIVLLTLWAPPAFAYQLYSEDQNDVGNCAQCHQGYRETSPYFSYKDNADWSNSLHTIHVGVIIPNSDCGWCHFGPGTNNRQVNLMVSQTAADGTNAISCSGCHGRLEDQNTVTTDGTGWGAGLRQVHWVANRDIDTGAGIVNTRICDTCHEDSDPAAFTPVGEDVLPPFYDATAIDPVPLDPCNVTGRGEHFDGSALGLDNDGDGLFDVADPDCQPDPDIAVDPLSLDFGVITVGTTLTLTTTISNVGSADLTINSYSFGTGSSIDFELNPATQLPPFTVSAGNSVDVLVDYSPGEEGADSGTLLIDSNDPDEPTVSVSLTGSGTPPVGGDCVVSVNPLSLDFGQVLEGTTATLITTITNNSADTNCNVTSLTFGAGSSPDFALNPGAPVTPFTVPPLQSQDVPVDYTPSGAGEDSGTLDIASDDPANPVVSVSLAGEGIAALCDIDVNPLTLDFGPVNVGETSTLSTTIGNTGTVNCTVDALTINGSLDFGVNPGSPATPFTVAPTATVDVLVDYTPSDANPDNGTLEIANNDPDENPVSVALSGTGSTRICSVSPLTLDYGNVELGSIATLFTTITNPAGSPSRCTVNTIGFDNPEFTLSPTTPLLPPFNVWPGNSVDVIADYTPVDLGTDNNTMTINILDADRVTVFDAFVGVTGTGVPPAGPPEIDVDPLALDFGAVNIGTTETRVTTIRNLGGSDLTVTGLGLTGAEFGLNPAAPGTPFVVPLGGSVDVPVDYTPLDEGADVGALDIASDDADEPTVTVALNGTGQLPPPQCDIDVNPLALDFASVEVGATATLAATVGNTGGADCTVNSLTLSGSPDFALNPGAPVTPFTVAPTATIDVPVDYTPSDEGDDAGTLEIGSNDPDENPVAVSLAGTGVVTGVCDIDVNPLALDFGSVEVGMSATLATVVGNTGGADCTVDSMTLNGSTEFTLNAGAPVPPFTVSPGATVDVPVDYAPVDEGSDNGTLDIASDDADESTVSVSLSGSGFLPGTVDLDIKRFRVDNSVKLSSGKPVSIRLTVENSNGSGASAPATVVGVQNGGEVYRETLDVFLTGGGNQEFDFPEYFPSATGEISWTASIADDDPDTDEATAATNVK